MRFATYLAPCNRPLYDFIARACGGELVVGDDWRELATGRVDVAFVCSPPLIWLGGAVEAIAAPVLADPRFGGRPLYSSEVVVRRDSKVTSLAELKGARWAVNEPSSWSGYWVTLDRVGEWDYFGEVVSAGFHQRAMRLVASGEVDAAAIDCHVLAVETAAHPELGTMLRVVETLGPAPSQPVVVREDLDRAVRAEVYGHDPEPPGRASSRALRGAVRARSRLLLDSLGGGRIGARGVLSDHVSGGCKGAVGGGHPTVDGRLK